MREGGKEDRYRHRRAAGRGDRVYTGIPLPATKFLLRHSEPTTGVKSKHPHQEPALRAQVVRRAISKKLPGASAYISADTILIYL